MASLTTLLLLPLSLLALYHWTTSTVEARAASRPFEDSPALHKRSVQVQAPNYDKWVNLLRRRRSYGGLLQAPADYNTYQRAAQHELGKRQEEWIWMPAHGYIPMPKDESSSESDDRVKGTPNLFRYG